MTAPTPARSARLPVVIGVALVAVLVVIALIAGNSDTTSSGPALSPSSTAANGTRALVLLLRELGGSVRVGDRLPDGDARIALLLQDRLSSADHDQLDEWVRRGGTLIVTDPSSSFSAASAGTEFLGGVTRGTCTIPDLGDVNQLDVSLTARLRVGRGSTSCFGDSRSAFVVSTPRGSGRVVSLGDAGVFTNDSLDAKDNSVLAARLLAPDRGTPIAVLDPNPPGSGRTTLGDLIADRVFQAILQLLVAFVLYALWRSRRVGQPVTERQPVAIAGSQFVRAVGGLQQRTHAADRAAAALRMDTRRIVCERYGIPLYSDVDTLATVTAAHTGLDRHAIARALADQPVLDEESLVTLGHSLDSIRQEVLDGRTR